MFQPGISHCVKAKTERRDGWQNISKNLGTRRSRTDSTNFVRDVKLDSRILRAIYSSNGIGKRVVNLVVEDALRGFIEADRLLLEELDRLKAEQTILEAGCKGRLYGGAIVVAFVEDARGYEKPLNVRGIEKVVSLQVFGKQQISWEEEDVCMDSSKEYFGEPEVFTITPESFYNGYSIKKAENSNSVRVHRSRCFVFGGDMNVDGSNFWDESVLEACYESLRNYGIVTSSSVEIVHDFIQVDSGPGY